MRTSIVPALSLVLLLGGTAVAQQSAAGPVPATAPGSAAVRTVTLITGDRVAVSQTATGRPSVTVAPGSAGPSSAFQVLASGAHLYVIPQVAAGYVGAPLDLSLFDVDALPSGTSGVLAMTATTARSGTAALLPGMTVTGATTLTLNDPLAFGRAMAAESAADIRDGVAGPRLFAGIEHRAAPPSSDAAGGSARQAVHRSPSRLSTGAATGVVERSRHGPNADNVDTFLAASLSSTASSRSASRPAHTAFPSYIAHAA